MSPSPLCSHVVQHRDIAIVARLREQDPAALAELYDIYGRAVFSLLVRMVKDKGSAEDLTQDTFLRIWLRARLFDSLRGSASGWVMTIARNCAIDYLRSRSARRCSEGLPFVETEDPRLLPDLERDVRLSQGRLTLTAALHKLPPHQRAAIDLAYGEGCTQSEIAERMGYPLGTVKTWVRCALGTLRRQFERPDVGFQALDRGREKVVAISAWRQGA